MKITSSGVVVVATALLTVLAGLTTVAVATPASAATTSAVRTRHVSVHVVTHQRATGIAVVATGRARLRGVSGRRVVLQRWRPLLHRWTRLGSSRVRSNHHYRVRGRMVRTRLVRVHVRGYGRAGTSKRLMVTVAAPTPPPPAFSSLSANSTECVVKTADSSLRCWGYNTYGSVGDGTTTDPHPDVYQVPGAWRSVDTTGYNTCGIKTNGTLWCWGDNSLGAVGDGTTTERDTPVQVGTDDDWTQVEAGEEVTCGLRAGGTAYCWGTANYGELGNGTTGSSYTPTLVSGGHTFSKIAADWYNVCGLTTAKVLLCWGYGGYGENGSGGTADEDTPTAVSLTGVSGATTWDSFSIGGYDACALTTEHVAYCWGLNSYGTVGNGTTGHVLEPTAVDVSGSPSWQSISTGEYNSCAVTTSGTAQCWGDNSYGELGDGSVVSSTAPSSSSLVAGGHVWSDVVVGYGEVCGLAEDTIYCWGSDSYGSLGTGSPGAQSETPVAVAGF